VQRRLEKQGVASSAEALDLARVAALYKDRVANLNELADAAHPFIVMSHPKAELRAQHLTAAALAALATLRGKLARSF